MARLCSKAASPSEVHLETPGSKATGANTLPVSLGLNLFFTRDGLKYCTIPTQFVAIHPKHTIGFYTIIETQTKLGKMDTARSRKERTHSRAMGDTHERISRMEWPSPGQIFQVGNF
ncbi:hypothetical protein MFRU_009g00910 [Monilinia fructicola]|nr:hypothetical protein MFRU_009g00910 [Monilinia fructicola]